MSAGGLRFVKGHGLGNDYLVVDGRAQLPTLDQIRVLCHRHYGIGSDGVLVRVASTAADFGLRIFNPDGSEAEKSGNGLRIFSMYLRDHGGATSDRFTIETAGGVVTAELLTRAPVTIVRVDMGTVTFDRDVGEMLRVGDADLEVDALSIGNPHCVVIRPALDEDELRRLGPLLEHHARFPARTNVQLVEPRGRDRIGVLIWERGAGYTLASGSSACAAAAACIRRGLTERRVTVEMPGGTLSIAIDEHWQVRMEGEVEEICAGEVSAAYLARAAPRS